MVLQIGIKNQNLNTSLPDLVDLFLNMTNVYCQTEVSRSFELSFILILFINFF